MNRGLRATRNRGKVKSLPVIKTTVLGWSPLKKDQPLPPIHVEFEANPELARVMQASLAAAGFPIAPHASTAEFRVLFSSYFSFDRSRTKRQTISVGKPLADQRMASTLSSVAELGTRGYRDVNLSVNLLLLPSFGVPGVVTGLTSDILPEGLRRATESNELATAGEGP